MTSITVLGFRDQDKKKKGGIMVAATSTDPEASLFKRGDHET